MIDTANMGIMANFIQPTSSNVSTQMISKKIWLKNKTTNIKITQLSHIENHKFLIFKSFIKSHK